MHGLDRERERLLEGRGHSLPSEADFRRLIGVAATLCNGMEWNRERERERKRSFVTSSDALRDAASPLLFIRELRGRGREGGTERSIIVQSPIMMDVFINPK